jgi:flagellar biosynthesis/type III secretory pathway M-ring protein FliF/YscJ
VEAAGGVDRLTVAVMVDREAAPSLTLNDVQDIAKEAVGFKTGRDEIKATDAKLAGPAVLTGVDAEILENQRWQNYALLARNASLGVTALVGLVVLGGGFWIYKRRKAPPVKVEAAPPASSEYADALQSLSAQAQQDPDALARLLAAWLGEGDAPARKAA